LEHRKALGKGVGALFSDEMSQESEVKTPESEVITKESELKKKAKSGVNSNESKVGTQETLVITEESELGNKESDVITSESEVNTNESKVNTNESKVISKTKPANKRGSKSRLKSQRPKTEQAAAIGRPRVKSINQEILEQAIAEGLQSPRISTWSPLVMAALRYMQLTTVRFSMSKEVSETLENAFREKYPELCEKIGKEIAEM
jgi:hypothetical protein